MASQRALTRGAARDKLHYDNKRLWKLRKVMLDALVIAGEALSNRTSADDYATEEEREAHKTVNRAIAEAEKVY